MTSASTRRARPGRPPADPGRDLRKELLATSRALLNESGPNALSMREVARRAGCTHQAPYHYFEDKEAILAALVAEGFEALATDLAGAHRPKRQASTRSILVASSQAYVAFALSNPGVFRVMFRIDMCDPARFPDVARAGTLARAELDHLNEIVGGPEATAESATILWAHVHGLACLLVDGPLGAQFETDRQAQRYLKRVGEAFADQVLTARAG